MVVDPALLAVVCDRVREVVRREFNWSADKWRSAIYINVRQALRGDHTATVRVTRFGGDWRYRIEMPDELSRHEMIAPIVEALLLEYANQGGDKDCVDLPPWLADGLTAYLLHGELSGLALTPNTMVVRNRYSEDPAGILREKVQAHGAMTIDELNWPDFDEDDAKEEERFRFSSELLVRELLRLRAGPDCLSAALALLPEHLNWQTAFLRGFEPHFKQMLDVEKWWSLVVVQAKTREKSVHWAAAESYNRLEDVLYTPMQIQLSPIDVPHVSPVALQTVVSEWALGEQEPLLQNKIGQLRHLRLRVPAEFQVLVDGYRGAIESHLAGRVKLADKDPASRKVRKLTEATVAKLNKLDAARNDLHAKLLTGGFAKKTPGPAE